MATASGALVVAERHSRLVRLDPRTGEQVWEQRVEDCFGTTVVTEDRCLYLSQAGVLHCFDIHNGQRMWSRPDLFLHHYVSVSGSVVLLGGWRGYRPLTRVDLTSGERLAGTFPWLSPHDSLAWPLPVRWGPEPGDVVDAVFLACASQATLLLVDARTGVARGEWSLPAPVSFPDSGAAYRVCADGRLVFLSGRRTVLALHPAGGLETVWRHDRDLPSMPPILSGGTLWLAEKAGVTIVDLDRGARVEVTRLLPGAVSDAVPLSGGALLTRSRNHLVMVDRDGGFAVAARLPGHVERLLPDGRGLLHAIGKGHLTTVDISTMSG